MAKFNLTEDDKVYYDVLKEIGNIGSGNAVTALAHMLNCKVDMSVPQVRLLDFKDVGSILGDEEQIMAGVYLMVEGDITGSIMFLLEKECSKNLIAMLMGSAPSEGDLNEIEQSALKENRKFPELPLQQLQEYLQRIILMQDGCSKPAFQNF